jgi:hypothetical protein
MAGPIKVRVIFALINAVHKQDVRSGWIFDLREAGVWPWKGWEVLEDGSLAIPLEILPLELWKP